uniref:LysM peptidoglycan-binding domain-containing protein n=1 Tax=Geobacter metallireducens TaxID=28232 RepID=A0A831UAN8_GEOME
MTPRTYTSLCAALALWGLLGPLHGGAPLAAPPSFELDLRDLETTKSAPKSRRQPARARRTESPRETTPRPDAPAAESPGEYTRYTVRPGDFLFKILIRDFGLSNAQAEALIPQIQRLNKLPSATRLDVGQTILIPRQRRPPPAVPTAKAAPAPAPEEHLPLVIPPAPSSSAPPSLPSAPPVPVAPRQDEPAAPKAAAPPPPAPPAIEPAPEAGTPAQAAPAPADSSFSAALIRLWEHLVPGQELIEPLTINDRIIDPRDYPLLLAADGSRILVDLRDALPPQLHSQLSRKYPDIRIVTRGKRSVRDLFSSLLNAAEFPRTEENVTVNLGADPSISVRADFRIVRLPSGRGGPESILLFVNGQNPCLPESLAGYLRRKGYQVAQFCGPTGDTFTEPGYDFRSVSASTPCDMAVSLLEALSLKLDRNRIVSGTMGENAENRFSIRVDGYFETGGKRYILNCAGNDPYNYTLFRLLQVQGYGVIQPQEGDDVNAVTERLLTELNYPHVFGRHELDYGQYRIAVTGFKVTRRDTATGRLLLTSRPADPVFAELLRWAPGEKR